MRNRALGIRALAVWPFFAVLSLVVASNAAAIAIYSYSGNNYTLIINNTPPVGTTYTTAMSVSGSFDLALPLPANMPLTDIAGSVLAYSFNDGVHTLTEANSDLFGAFRVETDALANISLWQITAVTGPPLPGTGGPGDQRVLIQTTFLPGQVLDRGILQECVGVGCAVSSDLGSVGNNPGSWTLVPEPSTAALVALGLVGFAVRRPRRHSRG